MVSTAGIVALCCRNGGSQTPVRWLNGSRNTHNQGITLQSISYNVKKYSEGFPLKDYIEERAIDIAGYIIENNATVRQTAKAFGISKSTVHKDVTI